MAEQESSQYETNLMFSDLREGMVLARPLTLEAHGCISLSLPAGQILDSSTLETMAARGADLACVLLEDKRDPSRREADQLRAQVRIDHVFRLADQESEATRLLYEALSAHRRHP